MRCVPDRRKENMSTEKITYWKYPSGNIWEVSGRPNKKFDWRCISSDDPESIGAHYVSPYAAPGGPLRRAGPARVNRDGSPYIAGATAPIIEPTKEPEMEIKPFGWYESLSHKVRVIKHDQYSVSYDHGEATKLKNGHVNLDVMSLTAFMMKYKPCDPPLAPSSIKDPTVSYKEPKTVSVDYWPEHW